MLAVLSAAASGAYGNPQDTVIIELDDDSKIVIYTKNKADLKSLEKYDINQMIVNLNKQLEKGDIEYIELKDSEGNVYKNDTTLSVIEDGERFTIRLRGLELLVDPDQIEDDWDDDWDDDTWSEDFKKYEYVDKDIDRNRTMFNVELGTSNWLENGNSFPNESGAPYSVRPWGSWYVGLNSVTRTYVGGPLFLDWGFGVSWYNWKMEDDEIIVTKGDETVEFLPADPTLNAIKSKLTMSHINFTLVPMIDFAKGRTKVKSYEKSGLKIRSSKKEGVRFGVGGYVGYRIGSHSKFVYKENGGREKDKERNNFYLQNFRYGLRAQFGWKDVDFFANYDLNEVFAEGRGPDLNGFTFGLIF
jgi:hypothetical protein